MAPINHLKIKNRCKSQTINRWFNNVTDERFLASIRNFWLKGARSPFISVQIRFTNTYLTLIKNSIFTDLKVETAIRFIIVYVRVWESERNKSRFKQITHIQYKGDSLLDPLARGGDFYPQDSSIACEGFESYKYGIIYEYPFPKPAAWN